MKNRKIKIETPQDKMKYEIANELGLMDKINEVGWGGLTAKETGRIGGIMTVRSRKNVKNEK
ncbi:MAG: small, acid-soluble spore protein, alpha/beta type [Tissierellales bacterium]